MKFRHSYKGRGTHKYVVRPGRQYMVDGLRVVEPGVRAEFYEGFFDSEVSANAYHWDEKTQSLVERFLMSHPDFGIHLFLDMSEGDVTYPQPEVGVIDDVALRPTQTLCIASIETDGESRMCGKPTVDAAGEFCATHAQEYATTGA